jgi:putative flippase GtrA
VQDAFSDKLRLSAAPALFALVGASSTVIDVGTFLILANLVQIPPLTANAVSYSLGAINSFLLNKHMTFRHRQTTRSTAQQATVFALARLACLAVSPGALATALVFTPALAAKLISIVITFVLAYALSRRIVFR